ncbi:hypothetical protein DOK67_0001461 [Enterococcus sp. DIV0212c]|uniref:hypothetical protein n=1 Tax=Enterococcus sp. DIV0212c TaxID=2230867 RepID=UPI001A9A8A33|nr:hypothetical protein [Enterococcus sp. DIV0212c]MBO1354331.1 hypothetical protein [Enterococcus sp. DIV0212c]
MKKHTIIWSLVVMISIGLTLFSRTSYALAEQENTEAGISFEQFIGPESPKPPVDEKDVTGYPTTNGALPMLGQMLTSFILLLLGVACLIIFLGVISLRKVYSINV